LHVIIGNVVEFRDTSDRLCGSYHYHDLHKSFFRGLYTPKGADVVARPPADHPHHKGLQYGLCAKDVNFWEEGNDPDHRRIGRQVTEKLEPLAGSAEIGFVQEIVWRDDVCVSFHETRRISAEQRTPAAYTWTWHTTLTATRDVQLIVSAWPQNGGYCGLGLRLAPDLFLKKSTVTLVPNDTRLSGSTPQSASFRGRAAEVKFEQDTQLQKNVLYVQGYDENSGNFAFMSLGPTNGGPCALRQGECLMASYMIIVADVD